MSFVDFNRSIITSDESVWPHGRPASVTERLVLFVALRGRTPTDIARVTGLRKTTVSSVLDSLESKGLITRTPSAVDGRSVRVDQTQLLVEIRALIESS